MNSVDSKQAVVMCVGNSLAGDDGAGCAVFERLQEESLPAGVRLQLLGVGGLALLEDLGGEELLVLVDAVQFGASPGTLHVRDWVTLPPLRGSAVSVHGIGLKETLEIGKILYPEVMPRRAILVGIEGVVFNELGRGMTQQVAEAVPRAAREVKRLVSSVPERRRKRVEGHGSQESRKSPGKEPRRS